MTTTTGTAAASLGGVAATAVSPPTTGSVTAGFTATVYVSRAPGRLDTNGSSCPQRDWSQPTRWGIAGVNLQPLQSSENRGEAGITADDTWTLRTRRGVDIDLQQGDRVTWDDLVLEVSATPLRWPGRRGGVHHVEATLVDVRRTAASATGLTPMMRATSAAAAMSMEAL